MKVLADGSTEPLQADDPRAIEVADYPVRITARCGLETELERAQHDRLLLLLKIHAARATG